MKQKMFSGTTFRIMKNKNPGTYFSPGFAQNTGNTNLFLGAKHTETLVETLYTSCIVDNLLLAGKERMACRAYINAEILAES